MTDPPLEFIPPEIPDTVRSQEIAGGHRARRGLAQPPTYICRRTPVPIQIDGHLDKPVWQDADWMGPFVDMEHGTATELDTRVAFLWDNTALYAAVRLEEPDVFGYETTRDGRVSADCEFEVFILGDGTYYELQINALNAVYEVFWTWFQPLAETTNYEALDELFRSRRAIYGNLSDDYPGRHGSFDWDFPGLKTAVQIDGTLNNRSVPDRAWMTEMAFPWSGMSDLARLGRTLPPEDGDTWRIGCSRVQHWRDEDGKTLRSRDWSICQHGKVQMHVPDRWPYIVFSADEAV